MAEYYATKKNHLAEKYYGCEKNKPDPEHGDPIRGHGTDRGDPSCPPGAAVCRPFPYTHSWKPQNRAFLFYLPYMNGGVGKGQQNKIWTLPDLYGNNNS